VQSKKLFVRTLPPKYKNPNIWMLNTMSYTRVGVLRYATTLSNQGLFTQGDDRHDVEWSRGQWQCHSIRLDGLAKTVTETPAGLPAQNRNRDSCNDVPVGMLGNLYVVPPESRISSTSDWRSIPLGSKMFTVKKNWIPTPLTDFTFPSSQ
jgi:hypothetical protein